MAKGKLTNLIKNIRKMGHFYYKVDNIPLL